MKGIHRSLLLCMPLITSLAIAMPAQSPRLGTVAFPTSAGPVAQASFEEGLLWMHSFEYDKAAEAFRRAQQAEPAFALAYWGEAMTHNHPIWNERDERAARAVLARLADTPAARAATAATQRERAWLHAAEVLWAPGPKATRDSAYADVMAALARAYPDDEAAAFHALAILGLSQGVRDVPAYMRAGKVALDVFDRSPEHPGAAHYVIHAFDDPDHAILGLDAARAYSRIAPDAGHAQHMTTHIFLALGMWDEVARQNVVAMQAARGNTDSLAWAPGHYTWWLHYARLQQGKWRDAQAWLREQSGRIDEQAPLGQRRFLQRLRDEHQVALRYFDQVPTRLRTEAMAGPTTILARGLAAWQTRDGNALAAEAAALRALADGEREGMTARLLAPQLESLLLESRGHVDSAVAVLEATAEMEAGLPMDFGPPAVVRPAHEALAELLLVSGRPAEAQRAFGRALARTPGRSRSLAGLVLAARAAGDTVASQRAMAHLQVNLHDADPGAINALLESFDRRR
jgi:tetratricopeptide (TPR) repeat protein